MASSPFSMTGYDASPINTPLFGVPMGGAPAATDLAAPSIDPSQAPTKPDGTVLAPHHHGFVKDALGFLGDFLMSRLHMGTPYRDAKHNEELQTASQGWDQDPQAAFNRMAGVDFKEATNFANTQTDNKRLAAQQASTQEAREARLANASQVLKEKNRNVAAAYFGALANVPEADRAANYSRIRAQILSRYGKTDDQLNNDLPETYDPVGVDAFIDGAVPIGTQRAQRLTSDRNAVLRDQGQARIDQGDRRLDQGDRAGDQRDATIRETQVRDNNTNARGNRAIDVRTTAVGNSDSYHKAIVADRQRRTNYAESAPKSGTIVTLPDGSKRKIK